MADSDSSGGERPKMIEVPEGVHTREEFSRFGLAPIGRSFVNIPVYGREGDDQKYLVDEADGVYSVYKAIKGSILGNLTGGSKDGERR